MTRIVISLALAVFLLVQIAPIPIANAGESEDFQWNILEKNELYQMDHVRISTIEDDSDPDIRLDEFHVEITFVDLPKGDSIVFTELTSYEDPVGGNRIQRAHVVEEGDQKVFQTYRGTEIYTARLNFPLLLEFRFLTDKGEGGTASGIITSDIDLTFLHFESPYPAGFEPGITTESTPSQGAAEKYDRLKVIMPYFATSPGVVTIVGELSADIDDIVIIKDVDGYDLKKDEPTPHISGPGDGSDAGDTKGGEPTEAGGTRSAGSDDNGFSPADVEGSRAELLNAQEYSELFDMDQSTVIDTDIQSYDIIEKQGGQYKAELYFSGSRIYSSSWDGPFLLTASIYFNSSYIETMEWVIDGKPHDDYEPAMVNGTFSDTPHSVRVTRDGTELTMYVDIARSEWFNLSAIAFPLPSSNVDPYYYADAEFNEITAEKVNAHEEDRYLSFNLSNLSHRPAAQPLTLLFPDVVFLEETIIYLTLTTVATGGVDQTQIRLKPTEPATGGPSVIDEFELKDTGVDDDGDGKYENLSVLISTDIPDGKYHLYARLYSPENGIEYVISEVKDELKAGIDESDDRASFTIIFPGEDIFISGIDGRYIVLIYLTDEDGTVSVIKGTTQQYRSLDFSSIGGREEPEAEPEFSLTNNSVFLHTDVFASEVLRNSPELSFYYYTDMGESVSFRVKFTRLIAFNDDGNGIVDPNEEAYEAFLSTRSWSMSPVSHGVNSKLGSHLSFSMSTRISLHGIGNAIEDTGYYIHDWGQLTLHFLIANNSVDETEFKIRGGEELKITVEVTQNKPLDINTVSLEQKILLLEKGDVVSNADRGSDGAGSEDGSTTDLNSGIQWNDASIDPGTCENSSTSQLSFENEEGKVMGYYSWACTAMQYLRNGTVTEVDVGYHARQQNESIVLHLTYPMSSNVSSLEHDPSVGVFRDNAPPPPIETIIDLKEELEANPWSYLLGLLMAGAVVFVTIYGRKPKPIRPVGSVSGEVSGPVVSGSGDSGTSAGSAVGSGPSTFSPPPSPPDPTPPERDPPPSNSSPPSNGNYTKEINGAGGDSSFVDAPFDPSSFMPKNGNESVNGVANGNVNDIGNGKMNGTGNGNVNGTGNGNVNGTGNGNVNGTGTMYGHMNGTGDINGIVKDSGNVNDYVNGVGNVNSGWQPERRP